MVQNSPFLKLFFLGNIGQENVSYDILERKNAFLGYKNKKLKNSKHWHFSKVVNPWFWSKNRPVSNFYFLGNIGKENVFYDILHRKNAFVAYKNKKFKKSKTWHFCIGVNPWFWSKNGRFCNFFFRQYRPGKCLLRDSRKKKKASLGYKTKTFKKSIIWHFSKAVNPWFWFKNGPCSNFFFLAK